MQTQAEDTDQYKFKIEIQSKTMAPIKAEDDCKLQVHHAGGNEDYDRCRRLRYQHTGLIDDA